MDNYPPGAANDPNAPYNQVDPEEVDVDICVSISLSKTTTITTSDYVANEWEDCERDEDGHLCRTGGIEYDFSNTDLKSAYEEQEYTIPELMDELIKRLKKDIENNESIIKNLDPNLKAAKRTFESEISSWKNMLEAAKGWTVDELEVVEE